MYFTDQIFDYNVYNIVLYKSEQLKIQTLLLLLKRNSTWMLLLAKVFTMDPFKVSIKLLNVILKC